MREHTSLHCDDPWSKPQSAVAAGTSSFGMSGVNAHAIFASATTGSATGESVSAGQFVRHHHWPAVTARHLLGPARAGGRGQLVFACTLRSQELSYLWDHKVLISAPCCVGSAHMLCTGDESWVKWDQQDCTM